MPDILLQTPRITLRRFVDADIDHLVALDSDPEVMRYINGGQPRTREMLINESLPRWQATARQGPDRGLWIACDRDSAEFLGWFHLKQGHYWPAEIEVGYRLLRKYWGRGLATEGTIALIDHSFNKLNEPTVHATTMLANVLSQRVMERSGMTFELAFTETRWTGPDQRAVKYSIART